MKAYGHPARSVAIAALWKHAGLNLREVAEYTGSTVCRAVARLSRWRATDRKLDQKCIEVEELLTK